MCSYTVLVICSAHARDDMCSAAFLKLWPADHKWSSGSALVVLLD